MNRAKIPEVFHILATNLRLAPGTAYQWWIAMEKSQHADTIAVKNLYQLYSVMPAKREQLWSVYVVQLNAHRLVASLEALWCEGLLPRLTATEIEEEIFRLTDREGIWLLAEELGRAA